MSKPTLIAGVILVIVIVVGGIYLTTNTTPTTVGNGTATSTPGVYHSEQVGLEFNYPDTYKLEERADSFEGKPITVLTLIDKDVVIPDMSEGPPVISVIVVPNPENLPLDQWIRTKSISNYNLANQEAEMGGSTVGDEAGLGYVYDGLYQNTAIAVAHSGKIYLFTVGTLTAEDQIKTDYWSLLETVQFI